MLALFMVAPSIESEAVDSILGVETAYASEGTRSVIGGCTWENTGGTSWKAKQSDGSYLTNAWYQDSDGSWYLMKSDGYMAEQLYQDTDGSWYLLDWRHEGTYGKLLTSGTYAGVYIQTNESHDGTWGRILNTDVIPQLQSALSSGSSSTSGTSNQQKTGNTSSSRQPDANTGTGNAFDQADQRGDGGVVGDKSLLLTPEEIEAIQNATYYR